MAARIMTIEDDDPLVNAEESEDEVEDAIQQKTAKENTTFNDEFFFDGQDDVDEFSSKFGLRTEPDRVPIQSRIDLLLERRKKDEEKTSQLDQVAGGEEVLVDKSTTPLIVKGINMDEDEDEDEAVVDEEAEKLKREFFSEAPDVDISGIESFAHMNICRPLQVGLTNMGISKPTPIQARVIPVALSNRDICACAPTGSGKTAAFLIPALERLFYKPLKENAIRVLVLSPTRELAMQVNDIALKLSAKYHKIGVQLLIGGKDRRTEETALRARPDILIATPGRLADHLQNTPGFELSTLDIVILDEADRLLELGFKEVLEYIVKACPHNTQTMLFSATMTDEVKDLMRLSLKRPCRIDLTVKRKATDNLIQEFVRIRPEHEDKREAIVLSLCKRSFKTRCMIFVRSKKHAHRLRIIFGLADLKAAELHGSLSQVQRTESLQRFQNNEVDFLICSDLAGRGLDIPHVQTVINLYMPNTIQQYIHRVGRTARAGRSGRSISLVGEEERKMMRELYKANKDAMRNRNVKPEVVEEFKRYIDGLTGDIKEILTQEVQEAEFLKAEMEERRLRNIVIHQEEIMARPAREWFQSKEQKKAAAEMSKREHQGEAVKKDDPLAAARRDALVRRLEEKQKENRAKRAPATAEERAQLALVRQAKRERRPKRMRAYAEQTDKPITKAQRRRELGFDLDMADTSKRAKSAGVAAKSSLLKRKISSKKQSLADASKDKKPAAQRGHKFKSKKRYKRR
eukprot:m.11118 g.11118  ORF g.11118 m.11118 type:complete len:745 (+) comp6384_c0_seq1:414-2648(+)